jgi:2'-5' RNA ligase
MKIDCAETWRVFCSIELPEAVLTHVLRHIARLKETVPQAKASWARDSNLHLTLKFFGEIEKTSVADFSKAISRAVTGLQPFPIRLQQTGAFPNHRQPRVLWIGVNDVSAKLVELHARLEEESARVGFAKEMRPFHPHLTIARLRETANARALATAHKSIEFEPVEITVSELLVIRSELSSEGSKYTVASRHALSSSGGKPAFPTSS